MPILPENRDRYPSDWPEISARIRQRAGNRCEECGVQNHALGGRLADGTFLPALPLGETSRGLQWPEPKSWAWCQLGERAARLRIIRIVLTVAHLNHTPEDCRPENLRAWCQRCHLRYDQAHHRANVVRRQRAGAALGDLFEAG